MAKRKKSNKLRKSKLTKELKDKLALDELSQFVIDHLATSQPIIELMKQGLSDQEILDTLIREGKTPKTANMYLSGARQVLKSEHSKKRKLVVGTHLRRYDRDITRLRNYEPRTDSFAVYNQRKSDAYWKMMETMHQKEKLLGMHSRSFKLAINNTTNINVKEVKNNFNLSKLDIDEKIEFLNLINRCKTGNIIIKNSDDEVKIIKPEQEVEDIEFEEVEDNINLIKVIEDKREEEKEEKVVLNDIENKIKKALLEKAKIQNDKKRDTVQDMRKPKSSK